MFSLIYIKAVITPPPPCRWGGVLPFCLVGGWRLEILFEACPVVPLSGEVLDIEIEVISGDG